MKLGLCILGCGSFAHTFSESLSDVRDEIDLYFASRELSRAKSYSAEFNGAGAFGSYDEAVSDSCVDAVYICTPHDLHLEHVKLAATAKKHILLEKPIAHTLEDALEIIRVAKEASVTLMIAENYRFMTSVQEAKRAIESGVLGTIRLIQIQEEYPFEPGSWRNDNARNGGGVFIDGGIHKVSILAYLSGRPTQLFAMTVPPGISRLDGEDGIVVTTRSASGTVGIINHTWSVAKPKERPWVRVSGTLANLNFELGRSWLTIEDGQSQETRQLDDKIRGIDPMVKDFIGSIIENKEPPMTGEEGLEDLATVLKAYESTQTGLPVDLD